MPYVLNSGSLMLGVPKAKKGTTQPTPEVYTAWDNNVIHRELTGDELAKHGSRLTLVDDLPETETVLDPDVPPMVAKLDPGEAVKFVANVDSDQTLHAINEADNRKSTRAAVTKRLKELAE